MQTQTTELPPSIQTALGEFGAAAVSSFGLELISIVLYGSAAEARLRATSDVNLIVVLRSFEESGARKLMTAFGAAQAAIHLNAMFLLEAEIPAALEAFAMKFADIGRRRHVLHGRDVFENLTVSRKEELFRLKQVLLNLTLRLREIFVARGRHEDRMALTVAEMAGPLRVAAATLLELEGHSPLPPPLAPKEALEKIAGRPLPALSQARETRLLPAGTASATLLLMIELANRMRERATKL